MKTLLVLICVAAITATAAETEKSKPASKLLDPKGKFTLYISNQSSEIKAVNIKVEIDGEVVVDEAFDVGQGEASHHNWKKFTLSLSPGKHKMKVSSSNGDAKLKKEFEVTGEHWAVLDHWFDPRLEDQKEKRFTFKIQNEPIHFK